MKRIFLLLCAMLLICLAGCDASEASTPADSVPAGESGPGVSEFPEKATEGLEYEINADGTGCTVTGLGECTDVYILIPDKLDGYAVTAVAPSAFYCNQTLRGVKMGKNVVSVGEFAFFDCTALETVVLSDTVEEVGQYAFAGCTKLAEIAIPKNLVRVGAWAFFECAGLKTVTVESLDQWISICFEGIFANPVMQSGTLLVGGKPLTALTVPETVTEIGAWAFAGCTDLTQITVHENVTVIGQRAFMNCQALTAIHYAGSTAQWKEVLLGSYWDFGVEDITVTCQDPEPETEAEE